MPPDNYTPALTYLQALILGIVQGVTEFLPVSSTAHMRVLPALLHHFSAAWPNDTGAAFSAIVQLGPIVGIIAYFHRDLARYAAGVLRSFRAGQLFPKGDVDARLGWYSLLGTIPLIIAGLALEKKVDKDYRSLYVIAGALILLALILLVAERIGRRNRNVESLTFREEGDGIHAARWLRRHTVVLQSSCGRGDPRWRPVALRASFLTHRRLCTTIFPTAVRNHFGHRRRSGVRTARERSRRKRQHSNNCFNGDSSFSISSSRRQRLHVRSALFVFLHYLHQARSRCGGELGGALRAHAQGGREQARARRSDTNNSGDAGAYQHARNESERAREAPRWHCSLLVDRLWCFRCAFADFFRGNIFCVVLCFQSSCSEDDHHAWRRRCSGAVRDRTEIHVLLPSLPALGDGPPVLCGG